MEYIITEIRWDTDNESPENLNLPSTLAINVPDDETPENFIADFLSDKYGFCVFGYNYEPAPVGIKNSTQLIEAADRDYTMLKEKGKTGESVLHLNGFLDGYSKGASDAGCTNVVDIIKALIQYRQLNINWWRQPEKTAERLKDFIGKKPLKIETSGSETKAPAEDTVTVTLTATQQRQIIRYLLDEKKQSGMQFAKMNSDERTITTAYIKSIDDIVKALSV